MFFVSSLRIWVLFVLGFQLSLVVGSPTSNANLVDSASNNSEPYLTNAQRLAAGLTPLAPKRRFSPTRAQLGARAEPSPTAFTDRVIEIRSNADPSKVHGYFGKTLSGGRFRVTTRTDDRLPISFTFYSQDRLFEIGIQDTEPFHYLGGSGDVNSQFVRTNSAPEGTNAVVGNSASSASPSESYIWKLDPSTNELKAVWSFNTGYQEAAYFYLPLISSTATYDTKPIYLHYSADQSGSPYVRVRLFVRN